MRTLLEKFSILYIFIRCHLFNLLTKSCPGILPDVIRALSVYSTLFSLYFKLQFEKNKSKHILGFVTEKKLHPSSQLTLVARYNEA